MSALQRKQHWTISNQFIIPVLISTFLITIKLSVATSECKQKFEGFGVFLGSNDHFGRSKPGTEAKVMQIVYDSLGISQEIKGPDGSPYMLDGSWVMAALFRTSYEQQFSPTENTYEIKCTDPYTCSWINVHKAISSFPDVKIFASIWSPPHYMKDNNYQLLPEYETAYLYFIRNITSLMKQEFNIEIERVSPVNEPENFVAPWDHTNMSPLQLCRIVKDFNDPLISVCPENAWFTVSNLYYNIFNCWQSCEIKATHTYSVNTDFTSPNFKLGYYDLVRYNFRGTSGPLWMTEICSTYLDSDTKEMQEALDLAENIVNFVGVTCVQRYYFYYAYTYENSGESLIWGNSEGDLYLPKKFFVYKLFVRASNTTNAETDVSICDNLPFGQVQEPNSIKSLPCIQFGEEDRILVNKAAKEKQLDDQECTSLCCVTESDDFICTENRHLPPKSVCHCAVNATKVQV